MASVLSAGTAVSFACDSTSQPYENENAAFFALTMICWPSLFYVTWMYATATNYFKEEGVIVPVHIRKEMSMDVLGTSPVVERSALKEQV
jgi:hypothetical protein